MSSQNFLLCVLYAGVLVYGTPHDGIWGRLRFGVATFLGVCFGVGCEISSTRPTWNHVESPAVWM
jgi:hypothetical protein